MSRILKGKKGEGGGSATYYVLLKEERNEKKIRKKEKYLFFFSYFSHELSLFKSETALSIYVFLCIHSTYYIPLC